MQPIQEWGLPTEILYNLTSATQSGAATTSGNTLFLDVFVRSLTLDPATVTVTDDGGNTWEMIGSYQVDATFICTLVCRNASAVTSVTVNWMDVGGAPPEMGPAVALVTEYAPVGDLIGTEINALPAGGLPTPITVAADQLVRSTAGTRNDSRVWEIVASGATPTESPKLQLSQMTLLRAYAAPDAASDVAIGWDRVGGSASDLVVILAAFEEPGAPPPPDPDRFILTATGWAPAVTVLL